jgi:hypothetical protein
MKTPLAMLYAPLRCRSSAPLLNVFTTSYSCYFLMQGLAVIPVNATDL